MSLINDALKRISQSKQPSEAPLMTPLEPTAPVRKPKTSPPAVLLGVLACVVILAGWFFWKGSGKSTTHPVQTAKAKPLPSLPVKETLKLAVSVSAPVTNQETVIAAPPPATPTTPAPTNSEPPALAAKSAPAPEPPPVATDAQAALPASDPTAPASTNVVSFPDLQLKAIAYHPTHGAALINNSAVGAGEEVDGVRVIKIEPNKVTVQWNGQEKELFLQ